MKKSEFIKVMNRAFKTCSNHGGHGGFTCIHIENAYIEITGNQSNPAFSDCAEKYREFFISDYYSITQAAQHKGLVSNEYFLKDIRRIRLNCLLLWKLHCLEHKLYRGF